MKWKNECMTVLNSLVPSNTEKCMRNRGCQQKRRYCSLPPLPLFFLNFLSLVSSSLWPKSCQIISSKFFYRFFTRRVTRPQISRVDPQIYIVVGTNARSIDLKEAHWKKCLLWAISIEISYKFRILGKKWWKSSKKLGNETVELTWSMSDRSKTTYCKKYFSCRRYRIFFERKHTCTTATLDGCKQLGCL